MMKTLIEDNTIDPKAAKAQQWTYNSQTGALESKMLPGKVLFEGFNKNLIIFADRGMKNQQFMYDMNK